MVRCMHKGVVWDTCKEGKNEKGKVGLEEQNDVSMHQSWPSHKKRSSSATVCKEGKKEKEKEDKIARKWCLISKDIKIVEDEFDTHGRPKLKIIYVDMGDYPWEGSMYDRAEDITDFIIEWEERQAAKFHAAPRLIFVKQDRDFWPGSETDPECVRRCKRKLERLRGSDYVYGADYRDLIIHLWENKKDHCLFFYNNPDMPGARFIEENTHPLDRPKQDILSFMAGDTCKCGGPDHVCVEYLVHSFKKRKEVFMHLTSHFGGQLNMKWLL